MDEMRMLALREAICSSGPGQQPKDIVRAAETYLKFLYGMKPAVRAATKKKKR